MNTGKRTGEAIRRILVVIDPADVLPTQPQQSPLLRRATRLARATKAEIELFYPCYDASIELSLFASLEEANSEKERAANQAATQLAELALGLKSAGLEVHHEVRWDHPAGDAILRKISDSDPDLVLKRTRSPNYVVGLNQNTDWELIRNAPTHIWFVKDGEEPKGSVLTAIGGTTLDDGIISESDYRVFRIANEAAQWLDAENFTIHCYQVPRADVYANYAPVIPGPAHAAVQTQPWLDMAELHGEAISRFAEHFDLDVRDIILAEELPAQALPAHAHEVGAGLLVMGARNLSRWERLLSPVAAEPVLAEAPCDVLVVKERRDSEIPTADRQPRKAEPEINVEMAVLHPDKAFKTPSAVVNADNLTGELRKRILDIWELDIQAQEREENEGGPVHSTQAGTLKEIEDARDVLNAERSRRAG